MDEAKRELVKAWMTKANNDLYSAKKLAAEPEPYLDTAIYHCQQAAEKILKAFLVFHDRRFEKTHDIRRLVNLAIPFHEGLSNRSEDAVILTSYATVFRYPDERLEPDREECERALKAAEGIYNLILSLLPSDVQPR